MNIFDFYKGKRVFVTGHTGFKGSWLCKALTMAGAEVTGYALAADDDQQLLKLTGAEAEMTSIIGDIRDFEKLYAAFEKAKPEIVFHLAAQPIVRESYVRPAYTYETNVMGTVNILECARLCEGVVSLLNVTTDKVYENKEWEWGYRENEPLNGFDPYSNSKSCSELVTASYKNSFFDDSNVRISTARAGNVIGGGDFAKDRIIPDCIRAAAAGKIIGVRNPYSVRPYQHVLEPIFVYMTIAAAQYGDSSKSGCYNVGPDDVDCVPTGKLVDIFCAKWGNSQNWENYCTEGAPHEANMLKLDCSKLKKVFGWKPSWNIDRAVEKTVEFAKIQLAGGNIAEASERQITEFISNSAWLIIN